MFDFLLLLLFCYFFFDLIGLFFYIDFIFNFYMFMFSLLVFFCLKMLTKEYLSLLLCGFLMFVSFNFFFCWNLIYFIVFFELSSFMVILLALIFGTQVEKFSAVYYFFFFSFMGFVTFVMSLVFLLEEMSFCFIILDFHVGCFFMYCFFFVFMIKFPIFFFHFWLPKIHVEASTFSSMLLASLLLKFGVLGAYRFLFLLKSQNYMLFYYFFFLGLVLCVILCLIQSDMKSQIAYSSVSHMSGVFFMLVLFGSIANKFMFFVVLGHAFSSSLGFWFIGEIYYCLNSRLVTETGNFFFSNLKFCFYFSGMLFLMGSFPFSMNYFLEFYMFFYLMENFFFLIFFFWFFFFDLGFVVFLLGVVMLGKSLNNLNNFSLINILYLILWGFNFVFLF